MNIWKIIERFVIQAIARRVADDVINAGTLNAEQQGWVDEVVNSLPR